MRPPERVVAENWIELEKWFPESAILAFVRSFPAVAGRIEQLEAQRLYDESRAAGVRSTEAVRLVAKRIGKSERTVWRLVLTPRPTLGSGP
jgi:hypothetical protein